ncbi:MAG: MBL fold metallo-hydrolase, partial [Desulfobacterota bacterium]|nr:MBL fold metallo-hydrolase [Thermodesulfobacteriota bacterium]
MELPEHLHAFVWRDPTANNANTYLINGSRRILIDPGHNHLFGNVKDHLSKLSITPQDVDVVLLTHSHPDHVEAVRSFSNSPALIALHETELNFIKTLAPHYSVALGATSFEPPILLREGELLVGDLTFQVIHAPGHSPGSICLYWPQGKALFTGDVIFYQGIGRTDLPGGNGQALKESIRRLSELEVEHLLPGHGEVLSGRELVKRNFSEVERMWFQY